MRAPSDVELAPADTHAGRTHVCVGLLAIAAAPLTVLGLVLDLVLVDFDAQSFRDTNVVLRLGAEAAGTLRVSYLLVMLGSYLLLVPLAVRLWWRLGRRSDLPGRPRPSPAWPAWASARRARRSWPRCGRR